MSSSRERSGLGGLAAAVGAALLVMVCCAGPLLVAGGALSALGGVLANGWLISVGAVILFAGAGYTLHCRALRRRGAGPDDCCPTIPASPAWHSGDIADRDVAR
ncbi:mercury transporter [Streptomyces sp. NPDC050164]|uniref:mercury transporter n=1 Tax=Streptomyces sp. NPDC050164 TaxID=3365605 RepID=UPI0037A7B101